MADAKVPVPADPAPKPGLWGALKETYYEFADDNVMTQSAALAFYSGLAMAPLLTVAVWCASIIFGTEAKENIVDAFRQVMGAQAAEPIKTLLVPASDKAQEGMTFAGLISLAFLAFTAASVFGQLQTALNDIWDVRAKPRNGILGFINKRLLSLGMLFSILFLLVVSLVISTTLQFVLGSKGEDGSLVWAIVNTVVSLGLFTVLFAMLFKYVPDARISWRAVWTGAAISAVLFTIGKFGLAYYLGRGEYQTSYGAAVGSFVALLVWVYYSSIIVLIGAEATEVCARRYGHKIEPSEHAVRVVHTEHEER